MASSRRRTCQSSQQCSQSSVCWIGYFCTVLSTIVYWLASSAQIWPWVHVSAQRLVQNRSDVSGVVSSFCPVPRYFKTQISAVSQNFTLMPALCAWHLAKRLWSILTELHVLLQDCNDCKCKNWNPDKVIAALSVVAHDRPHYMSTNLGDPVTLKLP